MPIIHKPGRVDDDRFPYGGEVFTCGHCACDFSLVPGDKWQKNINGDLRWLHTRCPDCGWLVSEDGPADDRRWAKQPS